MQENIRWKLACLIVPALIASAGMALAFEVAIAVPGWPDLQPNSAGILKDGDDDDDDRDDDSGRGRGGDEDHGDHDDDDDDRGDVVRPEIPDADLGDVVVEIIDEQFMPATFSLEAGQRVTYINLDDDEHTGTGLGFDTGKLDPGDWATVTIRKRGEVPFVCQFHSEMQGMIAVESGKPVASPSPLVLHELPAGTPTAGQVTIDILDFAFAEATLTIPAGTTVTWVNQGVVPHTVTGPFGDSGALLAGESFSFTFGQAGTFDYVCQFHPGMKAKLIVA